MMEIKNILTFLRIVEMGSFTKAANELGYSQSAVTVQIKVLEEELGVPLFDRIGKKVSLTPTGEEFAIYANEMASLTSKIKAMVKQQENQSGTLRVGILESLCLWKFCDLIPQFHAELPHVNLVLTLSHGVDLYQKLRQNEIDIAYLLNRKIYVNDCVHISSAPEKMVFIASAKHPLVAERGLRLEKVLSYPLLLAEHDAVYQTMLNETAAKLGITYTPLVESGTLVPLLKLVKAGVGVSFLPEYAAKEDVANGTISILDVTDCNIKLYSQIVYHRKKWVTPQMELFIKLIDKTPKIRNVL